MTGVKVELERFTRDRFRHFTAVPTRWGDCDRLGHINNVQFLRYYESGRLDYFFRVLDIETGPDSTSSLIIADIHLTFLRQLHHPCALEVGTRISRLGNRSFDIESAIFKPGDSEPSSTAIAACVWYNYRDDCSLRIPDAQRSVIRQFEGIDP